MDSLDYLLKNIYFSRKDLQAVFPTWDCVDFWIWMNIHGIEEYPFVRLVLPPLPAAEQRLRVSANTEERPFLGTGASAFKLVGDYCRGKVLDFGCGFGRVMRYFFRNSYRLELHGTDLDREAIDWCRENLPFAQFAYNEAWPPTVYPDNYFDCVYSVSVFSHLNEENHLAWLKDLKRITKPDGLILLTIHGQHAMEVQLRTGKLEIDQEILRVATRNLGSSGFAFISQDDLPNHLDTNLYGISFISRGYVHDNWGHIVGFSQGALDDWQDLVILRSEWLYAVLSRIRQSQLVKHIYNIPRTWSRRECNTSNTVKI